MVAARGSSCPWQAHLRGASGRGMRRRRSRACFGHAHAGCVSHRPLATKCAAEWNSTPLTLRLQSRMYSHVAFRGRAGGSRHRLLQSKCATEMNEQPRASLLRTGARLEMNVQAASRFHAGRSNQRPFQNQCTAVWHLGVKLVVRTSVHLDMTA